MNYIQLDKSGKKLYHVHAAMLADRTDSEVLTMARNLISFPWLSAAVHVAVRGEVRRRKINV